ncbi:hypothetical protein QQ045_022147 [Rhodiola kirilowii]
MSCQVENGCDAKSAPSATELLSPENGKKLVFVTNNSRKSRKKYAKKFQSLGITVHEDEIFSSSFAAAMYLKVNDFPPEKKVYVIGEEGILEELNLAGFTDEFIYDGVTLSISRDIIGRWKKDNGAQSKSTVRA